MQDLLAHVSTGAAVRSDVFGPGPLHGRHGRSRNKRLSTASPGTGAVAGTVPRELERRWRRQRHPQDTGYWELSGFVLIGEGGRMPRRRQSLVAAGTSLAVLLAWSVGVIVVVAQDAHTAVDVEVSASRDVDRRVPSSTSSQSIMPVASTSAEPPTSTTAPPPPTEPA